MVTLGTRIKLLRAIRGLSQQQLADATGIGQWDISAYENDRHLPPPERLSAMSHALDVDFQQVITIQPDGRLECAAPQDASNG